MLCYAQHGITTARMRGYLQNMIPKMLALIPANTATTNPSTQASLFKVPEAAPNLPLQRITTSDEELHKDQDNQIQLVKQIQKILGDRADQAGDDDQTD